MPECSVLRGTELFLASFVAGRRNRKIENSALLDVSVELLSSVSSPRRLPGLLCLYFGLIIWLFQLLPLV